MEIEKGGGIWKASVDSTECLFFNSLNTYLTMVLYQMSLTERKCWFVSALGLYLQDSFSEPGFIGIGES